LLSHLDDDGFVQQLVAIGGGSDALLSDTSLRAVFMPMLRADFQATEAYSRALPADGHTLTTPTLLVFGSDDAEASREEVDAWQVWLQQPGNPVMISGDHFYATRRPRAFLGQIMHRLDAISHGMHKRIG
jgi:yersiniabactin synthetase, thioesterase component